jgi:hypothetical protein
VGDIGIGGRIISKWAFDKEDVKMKTEPQNMEPMARFCKYGCEPADDLKAGNFLSA